MKDPRPLVQHVYEMRVEEHLHSGGDALIDYVLTNLSGEFVKNRGRSESR